MLKNKVVLITGASSGIGMACAKQFAAVGAKLLLCARRLNIVDELAEELRQEFNANIHTFELDVQQSTQVWERLEKIPKDWQDIDVLINNAGLAVGLDPLHKGSPEDWDRMIDTNIKGLLYVTKAVLPRMVERNVGHVINIGSVAGHDLYPNGAVYCATKHAVNALTKGLRMDLFGTKIRVSTVDPGVVETNFSTVRFKGDTKRAAAVNEGMEPLQPSDVADAVVYCATRPAHVNVSEMIIMPTDQAAVRMIYRKEKKDGRHS